MSSNYGTFPTAQPTNGFYSNPREETQSTTTTTTTITTTTTSTRCTQVVIERFKGGACATGLASPLIIYGSKLLHESLHHKYIDQSNQHDTFVLSLICLAIAVVFWVVTYQTAVDLP